MSCGLSFLLALEGLSMTHLDEYLVGLAAGVTGDETHSLLMPFHQWLTLSSQFRIFHLKNMASNRKLLYAHN